ncbi:unnamed protein product [marine sediment metagenome]|uniref:Uncharacterized protein n=1 Tax=marine sediment metagenome TaxID=412755 RepID=X1TCI1_9ZZZZ
MAFTAEEVLAILIGISTGGRGGGVNPENPFLGIPSLGEALAEDRARFGERSLSQPLGSKVHGGRSFTQRQLRVAPKKRRKVSAYQKEFGRQLKRLKKKHPRTPVTRLMKRAHTATRKARK